MWQKEEWVKAEGLEKVTTGVPDIGAYFFFFLHPSHLINIYVFPNELSSQIS